MCGIIGYVGARRAAPVLLAGLAGLEYRGYDSAGLAVAGPQGLEVRKVQGRVAGLVPVASGVTGTTGIGHTRWATHGEPSVANAHPQVDPTGRIAVVHNGIIENAAELRRRLGAAGAVFDSQTDTELLAHLIAGAPPAPLEEALALALSQVQGTYGLAVLDARHPDRLVVARRGSPVIVGVGPGEHVVVSDVMALPPDTTGVLHLEDGDVAVVQAGAFHLAGGRRVPEVQSPPSPATTRSPGQGLRVGTGNGVGNGVGLGPPSALRGGQMRSEIFEQPEALARCLTGRLDPIGATANLEELGMTRRDLAAVRRVVLLGCGSAYYAGHVGAGALERLARIPARAEVASELRYRDPVVEPGTLYVAVSQSGETLDTLRAAAGLRDRGARVVSVVNVPGSSLDRLCGAGLHLRAGPEISVASTKTFTATGTALTLLALALARLRGLARATGARLLGHLEGLPQVVGDTLGGEGEAADLGKILGAARSAYFVGRVAGYPVAREGAQKLKEVAYVHAEAYPSAELKHGPLALITPDVPTVAVIPDDALVAKNRATVEEIRARGGPVIGVGHRSLGAMPVDGGVEVPPSHPVLDPLVLSVPLQLMAYHAAAALGLDVDRPRNLAKCVTVE